MFFFVLFLIGFLNFRYLAHGTATDYIYDVVKAPMAFTFEVCVTEVTYSRHFHENLCHIFL